MPYRSPHSLINRSHNLLLFPCLSVNIRNACFFTSIKIIFFAFDLRILITWCRVPNYNDSSTHIICEVDAFSKFTSHYCENYSSVWLICCDFVLMLERLHIFSIFCLFIEWLFVNIIIMEYLLNLINPFFGWHSNKHSSR